ncbi:hypothetical protein L7F22_028040, partial [Adiantum nelumboides]|nr:hypothetical protein [Adiantum nelumboides]
ISNPFKPPKEVGGMFGAQKSGPTSSNTLMKSADWSMPYVVVVETTISLINSPSNGPKD